ncbi:hypothetical protein BE61_04130 [Bradyrhizobium elkanii USDA 61]|nr:hypothetical protein BE61_04130 [Bradyrhizobium elkanii USDA 61]
MPGLRLDPRILPQPNGYEQLQRGNQKGFQDVFGSVRIVELKDQSIIEDGSGKSPNSYEEELGACRQYQQGGQSILANVSRNCLAVRDRMRRTLGRSRRIGEKRITHRLLPSSPSSNPSP